MIPEMLAEINGIDKKERRLKLIKTKNVNNQFESLGRLIQVMRDDSLINEKVITMLQLDSYKRRSVLNNWLEHLQRCNASGDLLDSLSCLFDDKVAEKVLSLINKDQIVKKES